MDCRDPKFNECDCDIPYCDCNCDGADLSQENQELYNVQSTLQTLYDEMWSIYEWEIHIEQSHDHITFSKYLAFKLSRQEIIAYMQVLNKCVCCSRHTQLNYLPDLPKSACGVGQHEEPYACKCNCRHQLRKLADALVIVLY